MKSLDEIAVEVDAASANVNHAWARAWAMAARQEGHDVQGLVGLLPLPGPELGIMEFDQSQIVLFKESHIGERVVVKARLATDDDLAVLRDKQKELIDGTNNSATFTAEALARGNHPRL